MASDSIWREVQQIRQSGKPIIVSMGTYAASGGYYISGASPVLLTALHFKAGVLVREVASLYASTQLQRLRHASVVFGQSGMWSLMHSCQKV